MKTLTPPEAGRSLSVKRKLSIFLFLLSCALYINTLGNDFALDDFTVYKKNAQVNAGMSAIPEILTTPYHLGFDTTHNDFYRPLSKVSFAVETQILGGSAGIAHFINVLVFAICVLLLFIFINALLKGKGTVVAFITALLFALHPIHTEVVANIKGRDELLCFLFAFLAINKYMSYKETGKIVQCFIASFFYLLSLMSKETSICFLVIIPLVFFFYENDNKRRSIQIIVSAVLAAGFFLFIRHAVLAAWDATDSFSATFIDNMLSGAPDKVTRLATEILILGTYLKLLLIPYPLISDYGYNHVAFVSFGNVWVLLSVIIYLGLFVIAIYRLLKVRKDPYAFAIFFFILSIALFSNIPFSIGALAGERFLFFASAGFCFGAALLLDKWLIGNLNIDILLQLKNKRLLMLILPLGVLYGVVTINRNSEWTSTETLLKADVGKAPDCARLNCAYGSELLNKLSNTDIDTLQKNALAEEAIAHLQKAVSIYPAYQAVEKILSMAFYYQHNFDSAISHLKRATVIDPNDRNAKENLDGMCFHALHFRECIDICKEIIQMDPKATPRYNNIGISFMHMQQYDSAVYYLKKGAILRPDYYSFYEDLAMSYNFKKESDSARKYESIAQKYHPVFKLN